MRRVTMEERRIGYNHLKDFIYTLYLKCGIPPEDAQLIAEVQVAGDLWGVESHGVAQLEMYLRRLEIGAINPRPRIRVIHETPITAIMDGDNGHGMLVAYKTMEKCIEKARKSGIAMVSVKSSNHFGMAGYYAKMALKYDLLGFATTNTPPIMVPTFASEAALGNNPIAVAIPTAKGPPFLLDIACSAAALGKAQRAKLRNESIPKGWYFDDKGNFTTDLDDCLKRPRQVPLGGLTITGGHKGYGLAIIMEVLSGILSGASFGPNHVHFQEMSEKPWNIGHFFAAFSIGLFKPIEEFKSNMSELMEYLRSLPKAPGQTRIYTPGEKEYEKEQDGFKNGIPIHVKLIESLQNLSKKYNIPWEYDKVK